MTTVISTLPYLYSILELFRALPITHLLFQVTHTDGNNYWPIALKCLHQWTSDLIAHVNGSFSVLLFFPQFTFFPQLSCTVYQCCFLETSTFLFLLPFWLFFYPLGYFLFASLSMPFFPPFSKCECALKVSFDFFLFFCSYQHYPHP